MSSSSEPIPPSFTFANILQRAMKTYKTRTGGNLPTYLDFMGEYNPDEFRELIQDQARILSTQFSKGDLLLINRLVT
jgi:hypothetical protein